MIQRLLLEGKNDKHVFDQLSIANGLPLPTGFDDKNAYEDGIHGFTKVTEGESKLLKVIRTTLNLSGLERLGIIIDVDKDFDHRWNSLKTEFDKKGITLPHAPDIDGTIVIKDGLTIGIWLMPDNKNVGALEAFLKQLIDENDPLLNRAELVVKRLIDEGINAFPTYNNAILKAEIHTFLAWQANSGLPLGLAIKAKYFEKDTELGQRFINWVQKVFVYPTIS